MNTDEKLEFVINLLPLAVLAGRGVAAAAETFDKMYKALKDGSISDEEMTLATAEMNETLDRLIAKTGA